ncbi:PadR family transcriptional regulator [Desulfofalx alkaliphila]|uniref:PadR family transcriptional regulator n=1 Tax=Desulfofalx alkaliphila TaxID=105483 RepID=UPI0004E0F07E|nr:PadR family transcriptional regulator [Desulfofalx alkaliphila]
MGEYNNNNKVYRHLAGRLDKMLVPTLLFFLSQKPSHGYELIQKIDEANFCELEVDPATIYRNLRKMEEDGLVISKWQAESIGPSRRLYQLTAEGERALIYCVELVKEKVDNLQTFLNEYRNWAGRE